MSRIISIVGARPNFLKVDPDLKQSLIATGQHSDPRMSTNYLQELSLPEPILTLSDKSVGEMVDDLIKVLPYQDADLVIVYGDTNSSFAGAYAAVYCGIPVAHVEAGLRSGNKLMKEETNRIIIDHISTYRFAPTESAMFNLEAEGLSKNSFNTGDVLLDRINMIPKDTASKGYCLLTLHRAETVDYPNKLMEIFDALGDTDKTYLFPLHPRTATVMETYDLETPPNVQVLPPQSYTDMIMLESQSEKILTDSGGVQKEAYFLQKPCITLRNETEWPETIQDGWNTLVGHDRDKIIHAINNFIPEREQSDYFGKGNAFEEIRKVLTREGF